MADAEFEARRLAELLADANRQLEHFGEVNKATADQLVDAQMKAKYGINNYTAVTKTAGEALGALASAGISAGKSMLEGKKGAAALNSSLDDLAKAATIAGTALTLLMPGGILIKGVVAAFTAVTAATIGSVKAANEMADKLYKGYSGLAKSGGAAADGMTGVFNNAKKLGLSMNELDGFVSLINENSTDLARFSGSVADGRKRLADMGDALRGSRQGFLAMGLSMQDVSEGMANYMRLQARTGLTQERSARDQAAAAKEYIYETDKLAKLTGLNAKEQQKIREDALTEQMFLARIRQLKAQDRHAEAEQLEQFNIRLSAVDAEAAKGMRASVTGRLQDESARKLLMQTNGENMRILHRITNEGLSASEGLQQLSGATKEQLSRSGDQLALLGVYNNNMGDYAGATRLAALTTQDIVELEKKAIAERKGQVEGADAITGKQAALMNRQINTNEKMERALFDLIPAAQDVMLTMQDGADKVATAFEKIVKAINELLGIFGFGKKPREIGKEEAAALKETNEAKAARDKAFENATIGQRMGFGMTAEQKAAQEKYDATLRKRQVVEEAALAQHARETGTSMYQGSVEGMNVPMAAEGGLLTGPTSGYLAMLHGTEMVVPVSGMGKKLEDLAVGGDFVKYAEALKGTPDVTAGKESADKIGSLIKDISFDLTSQAKTFEKDAKNVKKFSDFQETYQRKMTDYMKEVLDLCEDNSPEAVIGTSGAAGGAAGGGGGAAGGAAGGGGGGILGKMMQAFASVVGGGAGAGTAGGPQPDMSVEGKVGGGGSAEPQVPSSGQQGKPRKKTEGIVYHHTGGRGLNAAISTLQSRGLAYHYMIDRDGRVVPFMPDGAVAYHAGKTDKNPKFGNWNTIGIAAVAKDNNDLTQEQIAAGIRLNQELSAKYGFSSQDVFGHGAVSSQKMPEEGKALTDAIKGGVRTTPEVPKYGDGGVVDKETFAMIGEKGPEAVIPLKDGAVPVSFSGAMSLPSEAMALFQQMANQSAGMMAMMEEMVRAQRNSVDVQQKMLRTANS